MQYTNLLLPENTHTRLRKSPFSVAFPPPPSKPPYTPWNFPPKRAITCTIPFPPFPSRFAIHPLWPRRIPHWRSPFEDRTGTEEELLPVKFACKNQTKSGNETKNSHKMICFLSLIKCTLNPLNVINAPRNPHTYTPKIQQINLGHVPSYSFGIKHSEYLGQFPEPTRFRNQLIYWAWRRQNGLFFTPPRSDWGCEHPNVCFI